MEETQQQQGLRRSLKARHMNMIAIGGAIGTGLFVAGGETVSSAGPGGALVAYALIGIMVYFLMTGLGEMASYLPVSGSFETYANRYVDKSLGFALGWNYWFNWAITVAAELVAGALIMKYWFPDVPAAIWSGLFLIILFVLNYLSTRSYGESEFIFAGIKVLTVLVFSSWASGRNRRRALPTGPSAMRPSSAVSRPCWASSWSPASPSRGRK